MLKFEELFDYIGNFSSFTLISFILLGLVGTIPQINITSNSFFQPELDHWCLIPELQNYSQTVQKYLSKVNESHCKTFVIDWNEYSESEILHWNWDDKNINDFTVKACDNGWVFDKTVFTEMTVGEKWSLVCDREFMLQILPSLYQAGGAFGSLTSGPLSDRFGRLQMLLIFILMHQVSGYVAAFSPYYELWVVSRFMFASSSSSLLLCSLVLMSELTSSRYRTSANIIYRIIQTFGPAMVGGVGYFVRDYHLLQLCITSPVCLVLLYKWILPESPRWLKSKSRNTDAKKALVKLARRYRKEIPEDKINEFADQNDQNSTKEDISANKTSLKNVLKNKLMRTWVIAMTFRKIAESTISTGVIYSYDKLPGSIYTNTISASPIEIVAIILTYSITEKLSRKCSATIVGLVQTLFLISSIAILDYPTLGVVYSYLMISSRAMCGCSVLITRTWQMELIPTPIRQSVIGLTNSICIIIAMASPLISRELGKYWEPLPNIIYSTIAISSVVATLCLPETKGFPLPETLADSMAIATKSMKQKIKNSTNKEVISTISNSSIENANLYSNRAFMSDDDGLNSKYIQPIIPKIIVEEEEELPYEQITYL